MKQLTRATLAITVFATVPALSMAAGQIKFTGKVTNQTCTVAVEGQTNPEVTLPDVSENQLSAAGMTAGLKTFEIAVSGCNSQATAMNISTVFWGDTIENGALKNTATTDPAGNVALQLLSDDTGLESSVISLNGSTPVGGLVIEPNTDKGSKTFAVRYLAVNGTATAGAVKSVVNYDITYQ